MIAPRFGRMATLRVALVITFALLAIPPMTASAQTSPSPGSGIEGVVFVSPSRPGPIARDRPNRAPAPNVQFVVKAGGATVKTFTTDAEGHFAIALPSGHYIITREDPGARVGHWQFEADVVAGQITKVSWTAGNGMR